MSEKKTTTKIPQWTYELVRPLQLFLLAQLVERTGIPWIISYDDSNGFLKFGCRYGLGKYDVLSTVSGSLWAGDVQEYFNNHMVKIAVGIEDVYRKRTNRYMRSQLKDD